MNIIILDQEIIPAEEVRIILTGRDLDLKKDLTFSKDPYQKDWELKTYATLKHMYCEEGIIWRAIKGRYDIDRGGRRLLRRHLAMVQQLNLLEKIWNIIK